jgi:hypothetical protein
MWDLMNTAVNYRVPKKAADFLHTWRFRSFSRVNCTPTSDTWLTTNSESESLLRLAVYHQSVRLGAKSLDTHGQTFFFQLITCGHSPYVTSSLTRGRVCRLQLLRALASAFSLRSESQRTHDHTLLSHIWDFPFRRLLRLAGLRWRYSVAPPRGSSNIHFKL